MTEAVGTPAEKTEPILAPEEIDALMKAVVPSEEADALFATLPPVPQPEHVASFDFESSDSSGPERYPLFNTLQQRMKESLKEMWMETFQRDIVLDSQGIEQRIYEDILEDDKTTPQVYFIYDVGGFGRMVVAYDLTLIIAYIDAMLGGHGETFDVGSDVLSPVEMKLSRRIALALEKLLAKMWSPVCNMRYQLQKIEIEAQFLGVAAIADMCFSVGFSLELSEELKGSVSLHYPRSFLEPVLDKLRTAASDDLGVHDEVWSQALEKSLTQVPITTRLEFGQCHLDIKQFLGLRAGDFLPLSKNEHDPATLWVSSSPMFEVMPGSQDGQLAAELLEPLGQDT
jgi:flagellar motor switch protein FliM